jgi:hypothetical protein
MSFNHAMIWVTDVGHYSRLAFANSNTLSLHQGEPKPGTTALYFDCEVDATHAALIAHGYRCTTAPVMQVWNWREACFDDPDGYPVVVFRDTEANRRLR